MHPPHPDPRHTMAGRAMQWRWPLLVAGALTLLMLGVSALYWQEQKRQAASQVAQDFQRTVNRIADNLEDRMDAYELVLRGMKGFFDSSEHISQTEFAVYIRALQLEENKPGLQGVSMIRWLDVAAPDGRRAHYAPIAFIEPLTEENQRVLGFDIATRPQSWEALERARDSGEPSITSKLQFAQDMDIDITKAPAALVLYLPLYLHNAAIATLEQRRAALYGWVSVQFRMPTLMKGLPEKIDSNIDLRIYDGAPLQGQLLYSNADSHSTTLQDASSAPLTGLAARLQSSRQLTLGGRSWTLVSQPRAGFIEQHARTLHDWIAGISAIGSVLLGWLIWLLLTGRERGITLARDITEHKLAYYDTLTGLPNRALLQERLRNAIMLHQRSGQMGALIFLDLDNFKQINDARGHAVGDALLIQVAQRLKHLLRSSDILARLGGDEFVLLLNDLSRDMHAATAAALRIAEQVRSALEVPHQLEGNLYASSASIGITLFPKNSENVDVLLREADTAMCLAKKMEHNRICLFESAMLTDAQESLSLEQDVKTALERGEISLYVQSQVNAAATDTVVGGELLLRWNHPLRGSVSPDRFISVAEESGLILRLGDWVIVQACQALAQLQATRPTLSLSVNVSPRQFHQEDFVERIRSILQQTGAPPTQLILEITETLLVDSLDTIVRMSELVQMGIRFSIDDFGTGYSSLSYLKKLPLFELKIDKSFINDIPHDPDDTAIVQAILAMAMHFNLRVVAEGVETQAQADFLRTHHCDDLQGYLFERPMLMQSWLDQQLHHSS